MNATLATATAKATAHNGLADALEYGYVSALRVNGTLTLTAHTAHGTYTVTFTTNGTPYSAGYPLGGSAAPLALEAAAAVRARGPHSRA